MKNRLVVLVLLCLCTFSGNVVSAKNVLEENAVFSREGVVIRPELYSGLFVEAGYQFNPYFQLTGGLGFGLDGFGGLVKTLGGRAYFSSTNFTPFADYHFSFFSFDGTLLFRNTIVAGLSYKNFDLGAGAMLLSDGYYSAVGLSITFGYNIRF